MHTELVRTYLDQNLDIQGISCTLVISSDPCTFSTIFLDQMETVDMLSTCFKQHNTSSHYVLASTTSFRSG